MRKKSTKLEGVPDVAVQRVVGLLAETVEAEHAEARARAETNLDSESMWEEVRILRIIKRVLQRAKRKQSNDQSSATADVSVVLRDSGTTSANAGWLERFVRHRHRDCSSRRIALRRRFR